MVLALTPDSGLYQLVLFLHILTAIVGIVMKSMNKG